MRPHANSCVTQEQYAPPGRVFLKKGSKKTWTLKSFYLIIVESKFPFRIRKLQNISSTLHI